MTRPFPTSPSAASASARTPLTTGRIVAAALAMIDGGGVEALSMRKLASALGVDPMSIYHHVPNKQALLQGVYQQVLQELPIPRGVPGSGETLRQDHEGARVLLVEDNAINREVAVELL